MNKEERLFEEAMDRVDVEFVEEPLKREDEKKEVLTMKKKAAGTKAGWILAIAALFICLVAGGIVLAKTGILRPENEDETTSSKQQDQSAPTEGNTDPTGVQPTGGNTNPTGVQPDDSPTVPFAFLFYDGIAWSVEDTLKALPEGFSEAGTIQKNDNAHVPQEESTSCNLSEGMKIYSSEEEPRVLLVEREDGKYILFQPYNGQILNFEPGYDEAVFFVPGEVDRRFLSYRGELWHDYGVYETLPEVFLQETYGYYLSIRENDNRKLPDVNEDLFSTQLRAGLNVYFSKLEPDVLYVECENGGYYRFLPYRADASGCVPAP